VSSACKLCKIWGTRPTVIFRHLWELVHHSGWSTCTFYKYCPPPFWMRLFLVEVLGGGVSLNCTMISGSDNGFLPVGFS